MGRIVAEHPEADLVVFPELLLSGYTLNDIDELAVQMDGPELARITDMARENSTALIFGAPECVSGGIANSAFCVDEQGSIAAVYRKVQDRGDLALPLTGTLPCKGSASCSTLFTRVRRR